MIIEETVIAHLSAALSVPVYAEEPENPPESFVRLEKTGEARQNHIRAATLALQSFAPTLYGASELSGEVERAMDALPDASMDVYGSHFRGSYNFTDPQSRRYRYQAVYEVTY